MDDQERKLKRKQALEEYQQIVTWEIPEAPSNEPPPAPPARKKRRLASRLFLAAVLVIGMAACYFYIGNKISAISLENRRLKEELAQNNAPDTGEDTTVAGGNEPHPANDGSVVTNTETDGAQPADGQTQPQLPDSQSTLSDNQVEAAPSFEAVYPLLGSASILHSFGPYTEEDGSESVCYGLALATESETEVVAAGGGIVVYADENPSTGLTIQIDHQNGYITEYTNNKELMVTQGQAVGIGQPIAIMGDTGEDGLMHMEFRVLYNGNFIDPEEVLSIDG